MKNLFTYLFSGAIIMVIATTFDWIIDTVKDTSNFAGVIGSFIIITALAIALGFSPEKAIKQVKNSL